jgi:uncharacterized delta-60 repeat protein
VRRGGKIFVAGESDARGSEDLALVRYQANGRIDSTFGTRGAVLTDIGDSSADLGFAITLHPGSEIVAGQSDASGQPEFALARYASDGSLDSSFGHRGIVLTSFGNPPAAGARALAVFDATRVIAAGIAGAGPCCGFNFALARYRLK